MPKSLLLIIFSLLVTRAGAAPSLTEVETRWLQAGIGVVNYGKELALPIDIIVQPQARPTDVPLAMGFRDGRCKLVLSMRGNPGAEDILQRVPTIQRAVMIEAMMAHEVGHCWRYAQGDWHALPNGFVETTSGPGDDDPALLAASKTLRETQREEGFSDLVALAWTARHHPDDYRQVYAWIATVRDAQPVAGGSHATQSWLRLAANQAVFGADGTPFEQARSLWRQGLLEGER